jgi:hypothetical protein
MSEEQFLKEPIINSIPIYTIDNRETNIHDMFAQVPNHLHIELALIPIQINKHSPTDLRMFNIL